MRKTAIRYKMCCCVGLMSSLKLSRPPFLHQIFTLRFLLHAAYITLYITLCITLCITLYITLARRLAKSYTSARSSVIALRPCNVARSLQSMWRCCAVRYQVTTQTASQPELLPQRIHTLLHRFIHHNCATPFAVRLARPFVGGINTHLAPQAGHG